ncbi:TRAP-type C4-dicarboxylate transport system substrate-binding protein [Limimaricola variabilis]|uniref:TRAP-type C4-dicarboxylate transport system substrate-binding protein n=1 Tax=Limimaricola variabilis TaxID=1492771 RepID=A0ABR6HRU5_9RHOB|nr:TRAP transporter substrate-binding protein DctP [Limimaricola variabilis]MBB3713084.1 TRAP-type C4-dicarboxylate transport system substrate-binding protein [Limimaricola variabilis]
MHTKTKLLAAGTLAALLATTATAQETTLRLGSHLAATAPGVAEGSQVLADRIGELSGGNVKVDIFPGEQAGKALQMYDLVKAGAVDIGTVATGYVSSDKLPLIGVLELPGLASSTCAVTEAMFELGAEGGLIYENELKPNGIRVLAYMPYPPYGPAVSRRDIEQVSDLQGLKMRNAGGMMEHTVVALGGVPVKMSAPEVFQALQRGTIDSVLFSFLSVASYDLQTVAEHGTTGYSFGTPGDLLIMSERRFNSMSEDEQNALIEAGRDASMHWCSYVDQVESDHIEEMREAGLDLHVWTDEQVAELNEKTASVTEEWAAQLDGRGKPATEVIEAFRAALAD